MHHPFRSIFLEGRGTVISGWDVGLLIQGRQVVADDFTANTNGTAGVELNNAEAVELTSPTASSNLNYGIWVKQTSISDITNSKTLTNGNVGLYVGCSDIGPTSSGCPAVGPSPGNYIFTGGIAGKYQLRCRARYRRQDHDCDQPDAERRHAQLEGRPVRREFELRQQQMVRQRFDGDQQPGRRLHQMTKIH